jgi:hypothetical protein
MEYPRRDTGSHGDSCRERGADAVIFTFDGNARLRCITAKTTAKQFRRQIAEIRRTLED